MDRLHDLKAAGDISRSHFSGAAERGTRDAGPLGPRALRLAMSDCSVVMAFCWAAIVCLASWSSDMRLRGTAGIGALGVE